MGYHVVRPYLALIHLEDSFHLDPWWEALVSPLSPVPPWVQWSNELAREMYIKRALNRLQLQYPDDS